MSQSEMDLTAAPVRPARQPRQPRPEPSYRKVTETKRQPLLQTYTLRARFNGVTIGRDLTRTPLSAAAAKEWAEKRSLRYAPGTVVVLIGDSRDIVWAAELRAGAVQLDEEGEEPQLLKRGRKQLVPLFR